MAARKRAPQSAAPPTVEVEPSVRRFVDWSTDLIKQAEISADSGNLRSAARLCEWIITDDRVSAALNTRVQALLGLDPTFEASGDKRRSGKAIKALDAGEDWWASYPEQEVALILKWGLVLGLGPAQHAWPQVEDHGNRWLPVPEFWHPYHVRFDTNQRQWKTWVAAQGTSGPASEIDIEPGDSHWLFHCPFGKNRPWAWGLWHGLAPLVLLKWLAKQDWSRASEKAAILTLTMEQQAAKDYSNDSRQARQQLATDIYNRGRNAVAALPPGMDLKLVQTVADTEELYNAQIDMANTAIAIMIRGGNLGTENDGGSRAATESQARTGDLANLRFDAQSWTTTVHDQSLVWWAQFNYGDNRLAPWPVYPVEPDEDLGQKTKADETALSNASKAEQLGFEVDRQAFLDEHKISWCKPGKKVEPVPPKPPGQDEDDGKNPEADNRPEGDPDEEPDAEGARNDVRAHVGRGTGHRLASGASAKANSGFISGQLYADALVDAATELGLELVQPSIDMIAKSLEDASDYESLRNALRDGFDGIDHEPLMELTERLLVVAHLNGVAAVNQDV